MWFDAISYLSNSLDKKLISKYASFLRNGIIIDTETLYLLIVGKYDFEKNTSFLKNLHFEISDYEALRRFLNGIKNCPFFITLNLITDG